MLFSRSSFSGSSRTILLLAMTTSPFFSRRSPINLPLSLNFTSPLVEVNATVSQGTLNYLPIAYLSSIILSLSSITTSSFLGT